MVHISIVAPIGEKINAARDSYRQKNLRHNGYCAAGDSIAVAGCQAAPNGLKLTGQGHEANR